MKTVLVLLFVFCLVRCDNDWSDSDDSDAISNFRRNRISVSNMFGRGPVGRYRFDDSDESDRDSDDHRMGYGGRGGLRNLGGRQWHRSGRRPSYRHERRPYHGGRRHYFSRRRD